jgi:hypothetical protein
MMVDCWETWDETDGTYAGGRGSPLADGMLQCRLFRHVALDILHGIDLRNTGHKAPTYRQTEQ